MTVTIELPLPHKSLSPNHVIASRAGRMGKSSKTKAYRTRSRLEVLAKYSQSFRPQWKRATVRIVWYHKTVRFPDSDNAIASLKAAFDGLTDAGILADDRGLTQEPPTFFADPDKPRVVLHITPKI